jgi:HEAT repeat protein
MFRNFKIRRLIRRMRTDNMGPDRHKAMQELVAIGAPAIPALFKELDEEKGGRDIRDVLEKMPETKIPVLIDALQSPKTRLHALRLLNGNDPRALDALIPWTRDPDEKIRDAAASAIGRGGNERTTGLLLSFLGGTDGALRSSAFASLAGSSEPRVLDALLRMLSDPSSNSNRVRAATALSKLRQPTREVIAAMIGRLGDSDDILKSEVLRFLNEHPEPKAAGSVAKLIDKHDVLSTQALYTLEKILRGSRRDVPFDDLIAITHLERWKVRTSWYPDPDSDRTESGWEDKVDTVVTLADTELRNRQKPD